MYKAEFEVEAITPIFIRGADQRKAEIRASSIKGLMRWWFRALAGRCVRGTAELKAIEGKFFGSTQRRSPLVLNVVPNSRSKNIKKLKELRDLRYLWFSIMLQARKGELQYYYPPGSRFQIELSSMNDEAFRIGIATIWSLANLGGVGFRARRGAGSIQIVEGTEHFNELKLPTGILSGDNLKEGITTCMNIICNGMDRGQVSRHSTISDVYISKKVYPSYVSALKDFQTKYVNFRKGTRKQDRIILGLPLRLRGKGTTGMRNVLKTLGNVRRASPLIVGLSKMDTGRYRIRLVVTRSMNYHLDNEINILTNWNTIYRFANGFSTKIWP